MLSLQTKKSQETVREACNLNHYFYIHVKKLFLGLFVPAWRFCCQHGARSQFRSFWSWWLNSALTSKNGKIGLYGYRNMFFDVIWMQYYAYMYSFLNGSHLQGSWKLHSGIVDTHPRRLQQPHQKHVASSALQKSKMHPVPSTGRFQLPPAASSLH